MDTRSPFMLSVLTRARVTTACSLQQFFLPVAIDYENLLAGLADYKHPVTAKARRSIFPYTKF
jgi:hypothetical protein